MDLHQFTMVLPLNIVGIQANFFPEIHNPVLNFIMKTISVADITRKNTTRMPDMTTGTTIILYTQTARRGKRIIHFQVCLSLEKEVTYLQVVKDAIEVRRNQWMLTRREFQTGKW
jgi:hypothetical protein